MQTVTMSSTDRDEPEKQAIRTCTTNQCMIDFTAKHLNGLRIECATTEEITQKEIREAEVNIYIRDVYVCLDCQEATDSNPI